MIAGVYAGADFVEMLLHGETIAERHNHSSAFAFSRANRSEDIDRFRALIFWGRRPGASLGPTTRDLVLLADTGFVLVPQLNTRTLRQLRFNARYLC